jgi:multiple sugar transport system substrate-binding protein
MEEPFMKKLISIILVVMLCAMTFLGCGSTNKKSATDETTNKTVVDTEDSKAEDIKTDEKKNLVLWMPPFGTEESLDKEVWGNILEPFEKENNVEVSIEIVPWSNYEEKYLTGLSSGNGPDIGYMYMEMMNDYIDMGAIAPFDDYLTQEDQDNFYYLDKGVIEGKQYALPIVVGSARVMFYNKDILANAGVTEVPATWEEFIVACKAIAATGVTPFQQQWGDKSKGALNAIFFPYLWQAGGDIFTEDGTQAAFNSEAGLKAAQFLYDLKATEGILPDSTTSMSEDQVFTEFKEGKLAFVMGPTNRGADFTNVGINWDFFTSLSDQKMGTFAAADSLVLVSASENKELAVKMAKYMLSGTSMTEFHKMAPFPPVGKDEAYNDDETFKKVYEENQQALVTLPAVKGSAAIYDNLYKNLQLMMLGELTPEEALNNSADYANNTLAQNE